MNNENDEKRIQNLFNVLQNDPKSVFYATSNLTKKTLQKLKKSRYQKDLIFAQIYQKLEDKDFIKTIDKIPLRTPFIEKNNDIDRSTLYSIEKPFKKIHADIADLRFFAKSAVDPKYALVVADLFTSKTYVYPMKNRKLLSKKLKTFYDEIETKRDGKMTLQTDLEFKQNQIKTLNDEYNVKMFHSKVRGGKAFAAEQKIREFKKLLLKSKRFVKSKGKKIKPNYLIKQAVENMNESVSSKYGISPENIEKNALDLKDGEFNREMYDFLRIKKIDKNIDRNKRYNIKRDKRKKKLRNPLQINEKVLILAERLKKKDAPSKFFKPSTDNIPFFNREKIFKIYKITKISNGSYLYWLKDENNNEIEGRFIRQELFALNKQFEE